METQHSTDTEGQGIPRLNRTMQYGNEEDMCYEKRVEVV